MSILATAGRAKIYNTDGTGRDSYVSMNNGGFTMTNSPSICAKPSTFTSPIRKRSIGGGVGSPGRPVHYYQNGSGRDSYISSNHGGFTAVNYAVKNSSA